jgi:hypothetical protein
MYADDTSVLNVGMNLEELEKATTVNIGKVTWYFEVNNLCTNLLKSNFILFQSKQSKIVSILKVVINNVEITEDKITNFLSVIVHSNLTWELHIERICNKISSSLFIIKRLSNLVDADVLITVYFGLVYPFLSYGITVWEQCEKKYTKRVFTLQKKVVRCTAGLKHIDSCQQSFISLNILILLSLYIYETILFVKDKGNCITNDKIHAHDTRSSLDYHQYVHRLGIHNSRPTIAGCKFYNKLHAYIEQIKDNPLFKRKLKQLLINGCYYSIEDFINDDFTGTSC